MYYLETTDKVLSELETSENGLTSKEAARRLERDGKNKLAEAIELVTEATELNPNFAVAYHERGRAKLLNGDKEGSAEDMKKGLELNPKEIQNFNGQYGNQPGGSTGNILGL